MDHLISIDVNAILLQADSYSGVFVPDSGTLIALWLFVFFMAGIFPILMHWYSLPMDMGSGAADATATVLMVYYLPRLRKRREEKRSSMSRE